MKLEAKDLRIGNYVQVYLEPQISEWIDHEISVKDIAKIIQRPLAHGYKPIPLTEEWLVRFGFEKHKTTDIYPTYAKGLINVNDGLVWVINNGFLNHIKHVHQLQNLYFALTGRELTLN
jgi:hypothetical protein